MVRVHTWMQPAFYKDFANRLHCKFYTSDGVLHDKTCRWSLRRRAWTFRFRENTWIASKDPDLVNLRPLY